MSIGPTAGASQGQARDEDLRWRMSLAEKARVLQEHMDRWHVVEGNYVPNVPIPADGGPPDHTTTGATGDMHSSTWTGVYLMGAGFRLGWARKTGDPQEIEAALDLGGRTIHGLWILSHIAGTHGLIARKIVYGHGPYSEERGLTNERNEWRQGTGQWRDLRYREHPSHHNYHHVMRGLAYWYWFLGADNPNPSYRERVQMDRVRTMIGEMMAYAYKSRDMALYTTDGRVATHMLWGAPDGQPSTRSLMATGSLRWGHWITGDAWYKRTYDELVARYDYRNAGDTPPDQWQSIGGAMGEPDWDDSEHILGDLWLTMRLEDDPELVAFYKKAAAQLFASKKAQKRALFNFLYAGITDDTAGADLPGALETMRLHPSDVRYYPIMNSIRTDVEFADGARRRLKTLLPFNEQAWDNSYTWKNDPFSADRYVAREIAAFDVSGEDPQVWFLADRSGALYRSYDGGRSFQVHDRPEGVAVRDVAFAGNKTRIAILATDRGVFITHGGGYPGTWRLVPMSPHDGTAAKVTVDRDNPNVVWAVFADGIYRSADFGMEEIGTAWEKISGAAPTADQTVYRNLVYGHSTGCDAVLYAALDGRLHRRGIGDASWSMSPVMTEDYHIIPRFRQIVVHPANPDIAFLLLTLSIWGRDWPLLMRTSDGGKSVTVVGWQIPRPYHPSAGTGLEWTEVSSLVIDPSNPATIYGASAKGVCRSTDGGTNWALANDGLRIPLAHRIFVPKKLDGCAFVSTPAGFSASDDGGLNWRSPLFVPNGPGVNRSSFGPLGYLLAYWPARYLGLIDDAEANRPPGEW